MSKLLSNGLKFTAKYLLTTLICIKKVLIICELKMSEYFFSKFVNASSFAKFPYNSKYQIFEDLEGNCTPLIFPLYSSFCRAKDV